MSRLIVEESDKDEEASGVMQNLDLSLTNE
jgi:hypothetical protein